MSAVFPLVLDDAGEIQQLQRDQTIDITAFPDEVTTVRTLLKELVFYLVLQKFEDIPESLVTLLEE